MVASGAERAGCATKNLRDPQLKILRFKFFEDSEIQNSMQTQGSAAGFGMGEREEELRRRNEDVDRRRAEAMRLASDVVRHQEVRALHIRRSAACARRAAVQSGEGGDWNGGTSGLIWRGC